jgi:hypothetical protein
MKLLGAVAGGAAAVAGAAPAQALSDYGDLVATWQGSNPTGRPVPTGNGGVFRFLRDNANPLDDFAGVLVNNNPVNTFIGVCIELGEFVSTTKSTFTIRDLADAPIDSVPIMGPQRANDVAKLVTLAFGGYLSNALTVGVATVTAFQHALWEITVERSTGPGNYNLGLGTVTSGNAQAIAWINQLNSEFNNPNSMQTVLARNLFALTNGGDPQADDRQDMLVQTPIPAAAWLLGSGLLGLFGISRRRQVAAA